MLWEIFTAPLANCDLQMASFAGWRQLLGGHWAQPQHREGPNWYAHPTPPPYFFCVDACLGLRAQHLERRRWLCVGEAGQLYAAAIIPWEAGALLCLPEYLNGGTLPLPPQLQQWSW